MDHTPGSVMCETAKPAPTAARRSTSAGYGNVLSSVQMDIGAVSLTARKVVHCSVLNPRAQQSFHFFDFFQPCC